MTWVTDNYKNPTQAQLLAEKARKMLFELEVECGCEIGECPKEAYFPWPMEGTSIPKGTMLPSYSPITKTCRRCELANILNNIEDPDDVSSAYT